MTTFDPEATIERAAEAIAARSALLPTVCSFDVASARASLSPIAADVLAPIEAALDEWHEGNATAVLVHVEQAIADIKAKAGVR